MFSIHYIAFLQLFTDSLSCASLETQIGEGTWKDYHHFMG